MNNFEFISYDGSSYPYSQVEAKVETQSYTPFPVESPVESTKSDPAFNTAVQFFNVGQPRYSSKDYKSYVTEGYARNPTVYRVVNLLARTMSGIRWRAYTDERLKREVTDHPLLTLFKKPNPRMARTRFLKECFTHWLIAGNAYIYGNRPSKNAPPQELWLLRPDRVKIIPGENDIQAYRYGVNPQSGLTYEPRDVLHLSMINPEDDWYGLSPLSVISALIDMQNEGQGWNLALMQSSGRPSGALVYPTQIRGEQLNQIERQVDMRLSGKRNAGRPLILDNNINYIEMGKTPLDMDWGRLREMNMREMAASNDVAPELVGDAAGKTFANVHEANQALYTEKALPMMDEFMDEINMWLPPMYDQPIYLAYDRSDIEALAENKQVASTRATTGWNSGKLTLNEARKMEGEEAIPGGDVLKLNGAIVPIAYLEQYAEQAIVAKLAGLQNAALAAQQPTPPNISTNNTPTQQNGGQSSQKEPSTTTNATTNPASNTSTQPARTPAKPVSGDKASGTARDTKAFNLTSNEQKAAFHQQMEDARARWDEEATRRIADYFKSEHKTVVKALKAQPDTAGYVTALEDVLDKQSDKLRDVLVRLYQDVGEDIGNEVLQSFPDEDNKVSDVGHEHKALTVSMFSKGLVARLLAMAGQKVKDITATTLKALQGTLADGVAQGESIPQLAKRLDALYIDEIIPNRSVNVARTEVVGASNFASHEAAGQFSDQYGVQLTKVWLATPDSRTRPAHADADGQEVPLDQPFEVGGEELMYPGDSENGSADNICQCRCTQYYNRASNSASSDESDMESASNSKLISLERKRRYNPYRDFQEAACQ